MKDSRIDRAVGLCKKLVAYFKGSKIQKRDNFVLLQHYIILNGVFFLYLSEINLV